MGRGLLDTPGFSPLGVTLTQMLGFLEEPLIILCLLFSAFGGDFLRFTFATLSLITHSHYQNFNNIQEFRLPSPSKDPVASTRFVGLYGRPPSCSRPLPSKLLSSSLRAAAYPAGPKQLLGNGGGGGAGTPGKSLPGHTVPGADICLSGRNPPSPPGVSGTHPTQMSPRPCLQPRASRALQWLGPVLSS